MKRIFFLLIFLLILTACTKQEKIESNQSITTFENKTIEHAQEELVINISAPYLMEKPMYRDNNGRLLEVEKIEYMRCKGCFSVYYNFLINNQKQIEKIKARVDIDNFNPVLADFTRNGPISMNTEQCIYYNDGQVLKDCINMTSIANVGDLRCCI